MYIKYYEIYYNIQILQININLNTLKQLHHINVFMGSKDAGYFYETLRVFF